MDTSKSVSSSTMLRTVGSLVPSKGNNLPPRRVRAQRDYKMEPISFTCNLHRPPAFSNRSVWNVFFLSVILYALTFCRRLLFMCKSRRTPTCLRPWPSPLSPFFTSWSRRSSCSLVSWDPLSKLLSGEQLRNTFKMSECLFFFFVLWSGG